MTLKVAMAFDTERYRRDVLEPARSGGGQPPADLLVRYALTAELLGDRDGFDRRVAEVVNYWRTLKQRRTYAKLADGLLAAHAALERQGALDPGELGRLTRSLERQARERLARRLPSLAAASSCVTPATAARLTISLGGGLDEAAVRTALREHGVQVVDPIELPAQAPGRYRELRRSLDVLGLRLSAEVVLGDAVGRGFRVLNGFRLSGRGGPQLTSERIAAARRQLDTVAQDERKTAAATVLTVLAAEAATPTRLDALLLYEVVELLRPSAESGLPQRALAEEAIGLGLNPEEAGLLALSLLHVEQGQSFRVASVEISDALREGKLREAQRLARALPRNDATRGLLEQVEQAAEEAARLHAQAERARSDRRLEDAAELYRDALAIAGDDPDLRNRYRGLPPPAPVAPRAVVTDGGHVAISWSSSPIRVGTVRYRVVRSAARPADDPTHGGTLGETDGNQLTDAEPPVGEQLYYTLFARREDAWSQGVPATPVVVLPEVRDLRLVADAGSVSASWRLPPGAVRVSVTRAVSHPRGTSDDASQPVRSVTPLDFRDTDVRNGVTYQYCVKAVYLSADGTPRASRGLVSSATPESLTAVRDLRIDVLAGHGALTLRAEWTEPPGGAVSLRLSDTAPPWAAGADVPPTDIAAFGRLLPGVPEPIGSRQARLTVSVAQAHGRCFVTPVTIGRDRTIVGRGVELLVSEPVSRMTHERLGDTVRLAWVWPSGGIAAKVRWWPAGVPGGTVNEVVCQRSRYEADGGFALAVGPDAVKIRVEALISDGTADLVAPAVEVEVPALGASVHWSIRRGDRRHGRRRRRLVLVADVACTLPPLVVVQRPGSVLPTGPHQGQVIQRVTPRELDPHMPVVVDLDLAALPGVSRLGCFAAPESATNGVTLIPPAPRELEVG